MRKFTKILFIPLFIFQLNCLANKLSISNVALNGRNVALDFTLINFDISWENSWRTSAGPSNWDAAWVFAKYRLKTTDVWNHAILHYVDGTGSGDGHTEPANTNIYSTNDNGAGGAYGVFIHRDADLVQANVSYTGVKLQWDYGVNGLADGDSVEICVFGIEMVYIPQGNFYLGDGNATYGQFEAGLTGVPYLVPSEAILTLGGAGATVGNNNRVGQANNDDFTDATPQTLPAAFPKGFNAFYVMKYELSQEQYVGFMNKLTRAQQSLRILANATGEFMENNATSVTPSNRNGVKIQNYTSGILPIIYGNDLDDDDSFSDIDDGLTTACNFVSVADAMAYLDWAGLRPITEFEFEKICRGPSTQTAVLDEYAWGSIAILGATTYSNPGRDTELADAPANCTYNNAAGVQTPLRVGQYAEAAATRVTSGSGYFGALDFSGSLWEFCINVGTNAGRNFTGTHGDGVLDPAGSRTNADWPSITTGAGYGLRGGNWSTTIVGDLTISGRRVASWVTGTTSGVPARYSTTTCRGGRTAP